MCGSPSDVSGLGLRGGGRRKINGRRRRPRQSPVVWLSLSADVLSRFLVALSSRRSCTLEVGRPRNVLLYAPVHMGRRSRRRDDLSRRRALLRADVTVAAGPPPPLTLVGRVLDEKYRLDARLGEGGMGTVYRATHLLIERPVAVKVLNSRLVTDESARERFRREARAAGRLQHTNAVAVTDFGETKDGLVYLVMELLEGAPAARGRRPRGRRSTRARAVSVWSGQRGRRRAHEAGVIHATSSPATSSSSSAQRAAHRQSARIRHR